MSRFRALSYLVFAGLIAIVAAASLVAMIRALLVRDTLSAVESALGTAVLTIILAVAATKLFKAGLKGWQQNA